MTMTVTEILALRYAMEVRLATEFRAFEESTDMRINSVWLNRRTEPPKGELYKVQIQLYLRD